MPGQKRVRWHFAAHKQLRKGHGEHWAGPYLGRSSWGLSFLCLLLSFLVPTYIRFRVWGLAAPGVPSSPCTDPCTQWCPRQHTTALCHVGTHTSSSVPYHFLLFSLPLFLPSKYRGNPMRSQTLHWTPPFVSSSIPGTLRGAATAPVTDVQPCLETLFWL